MRQAWEYNHPDLFANEPPRNNGVGVPDPGKVRARLHKILAEARAVQAPPWAPARVLLYRIIFPQMTRCLPEDEAAQLRFEFEAEMARLALQ